jgi:hypothetical protein
MAEEEIMRLPKGLAELHTRLVTTEIGEPATIVARDGDPEPLYCSGCKVPLRAPPSKCRIAFAEAFVCGFAMFLCPSCRREAKPDGQIAANVLNAHETWHEVKEISRAVRMHVDCQHDRVNN